MGAQANDDDAPEWFKYQEDVAKFFRTLGVRAQTNVRVQGVRGSHDGDVLVELESAGITVTWVVECKAWSRPVGKDRVLVLSGIVDDIGADRGLIVAEAGYQAGAIRATEQSNLTLTSLADLSENTNEERERVARDGVAARIYHLSAIVREAWSWAPPSTPAVGLDLDSMVSFAGDVFELNSMILPRLMSMTFPIVINTPAGESDTARDLASAQTKLKARLDAAEAEAAALTLRIESARRRATDLIDALAASITELIEAGRELGNDLLADEERLRRFAAAMRPVGSLVGAIRPVVPREVRDLVRALHRWLIDSIFVVADQIVPDWDAAATELASRIPHLRTVLAATAPKTTTSAR